MRFPKEFLVDASSRVRNESSEVYLDECDFHGHIDAAEEKGYKAHSIEVYPLLRITVQWSKNDVGETNDAVGR